MANQKLETNNEAYPVPSWGHRAGTIQPV